MGYGKQDIQHKREVKEWRFQDANCTTSRREPTQTEAT